MHVLQLHEPHVDQRTVKTLRNNDPTGTILCDFHCTLESQCNQNIPKILRMHERLLKMDNQLEHLCIEQLIQSASIVCSIPSL